MSAVDVLVQNSSKDLQQLKVSRSEDKKVEQNKAKTREVTDGKHEQLKPSRIVYSKEELLELRSAPASLKRPDCLPEKFMRDGVWDIEGWHKSSSSRSASPAVDGKCVTFESGKKIELLDNAIELAPRRRSFCQGCHVQPTSESNNKDKESLLKILGGKTSLVNDNKLSGNEGRDRLTARASLRRRTLEKTRTDSDPLRPLKTNYDQKNNEDFRRDQRSYTDRKEDKRNNRNYRERERNDDNKENRRGEKNYSDNRAAEWHNHNLPEWMTDGPSSQTDVIELKGFNKEIEDERNAMRKENKNQSSKGQAERITKSSSRSSTPNERKLRKTSRDQTSDTKVKEDVSKESNKHYKDGPRRHTPTERMFEDNGYFDVMDYLPPHLFNDDFNGEASSQSKFSQFFRSHGGSSGENSRPNSVPLGLDPRQMQGFRSDSPAMPLQPFFTPIQPAPPTHPFENPISVSPLLELFPKRRSPSVDNSKEVKGRMTLKDIEPELPKPIGQKPEKAQLSEENNMKGSTAFDKLVTSMKAAGQLPEKPAPVVSGLPEHLLPKPPKRTSPSFEKLKRALSRSPSPLNAGRISPLNFANRVASPVVAPFGERLLSPEFFKQPVKQRSVSPGSFFSEYQDAFGLKKGNQKSYQRHTEDDPRNYHLNQQRKSSFNSDLQTPDSFRNSKQKGNTRVPAAFLPTSVIKKMHSEKNEAVERRDIFESEFLGKLEFSTPHASFDQNSEKAKDHNQEPKLSSDLVAFGKGLPQSPKHSLDGLLNDKGSEKAAFTKQPTKVMDVSSRTNVMENHGPVGRNLQTTGQMHNDYNLSSNGFQGVNKAVGSGSLFSKSRDDAEPGKRNFFDVKQDAGIDNGPNTVANRLQMAPSTNGSSQGISNDIRMTPNDHFSKGHGSGMQPRTSMNQNFFPNGPQNQAMNQPVMPRGPLPQKSQQQQPPHPSQFPRGRNPSQNNPRLPVAMNPTTNNTPFNRPNIPAVTAAMAAQLVHQQLLQQAARAHALQAAQAIQHQQQQNLLRTQMQAAMAQAYVRGQAAKAMMYNPRAVANNLQAVAQQMGLRGPHPAQAGKPLPTPLLNQQKEEGATIIGDKQDDPSQKLNESPLSKWFNVDAIKKTPPAPAQDPAAKAKIISVEDLERSQK